MERNEVRFIVGIDEVGRGALAGPVVVAALALPIGFRAGNSALGPLKDSKRLTRKKREAWCTFFEEKSDIRWAISKVFPRTIDRMGIGHAANLAATRALQRIFSLDIPAQMCRVYLDGSLYLVGRYEGKDNLCPVKTVVRGDEKINAVKAASIIAKVHRDFFMERLSEQYPGYGFDQHKGYGTYAHKRVIQKDGPSPVHRRSFKMS